MRELEHTVERAVVLSRGGVITAENLAMEVDREIAIIDLNQQLTNGKTLVGRAGVDRERAISSARCCARTAIGTPPPSCLA